MPNYSRKDVMDIVKENDVKFVRLQFTDIFGVMKNAAIPVEQLHKAMDNSCMFDGSSIEGFSRIEESDMYLQPDLNTFVTFPWRPENGRVARLICDVINPDGTPFEGDPRYILRKAIRRAEDMGYDSFNVGPECEFFLFSTDSDGKPTTQTHDDAGYFDLAPVDLGENARRDMVLSLEGMGFEIEASHHEAAPGQHEIDFRYADALTTADGILTFKMVVKMVAQRHGLHATFMPKPLFGHNGSGMHINQSLFKDGANAFFDPNDKLQLSQEAYWFIGGLMKHINQITALCNPLVNSYKRLIPGYEAPVYVAWSERNRSPLIRIPAARGMATRIELRSPDPAANPYLSLAAILSAGLDGIANKITPPQPVDKNVYSMGEEMRQAQGIGNLPGNLKEALKEMQSSAFVREVMGDHVFNKYIEAKMSEWNAYRETISPWEIENYLNKY